MPFRWADRNTRANYSGWGGCSGAKAYSRDKNGSSAEQGGFFDLFSWRIFVRTDAPEEFGSAVSRHSSFSFSAWSLCSNRKTGPNAPFANCSASGRTILAAKTSKKENRKSRCMWFITSFASEVRHLNSKAPKGFSWRKKNATDRTTGRPILTCMLSIYSYIPYLHPRNAAQNPDF